MTIKLNFDDIDLIFMVKQQLSSSLSSVENDPAKKSAEGGFLVMLRNPLK